MDEMYNEYIRVKIDNEILKKKIYFIKKILII